MKIDIDYIDVINVPAYVDGNYADFDRVYFDFKYKNSPKCLDSKRATFSLILAVIFFAFSFLTQIELLIILFRIMAVFACLWNRYEQRYVHYYIKAEKYSHREKYFLKMLKNFEMLLSSKRVYVTGMPVAYNILKAKELLYKRDIITAEYLIDNALKDYSDCAEAKYVKGLCLFLNSNTAGAKQIFEDVIKSNINASVKNAASALLDIEISKH